MKYKKFKTVMIMHLSTKKNRINKKVEKCEEFVKAYGEVASSLDKYVIGSIPRITSAIKRGKLAFQRPILTKYQRQ